MVLSRMVSFTLGALMSIAPAIMFGQHTSGSINGTVSDTEGQVIVGGGGDADEPGHECREPCGDKRERGVCVPEYRSGAVHCKY